MKKVTDIYKEYKIMPNLAEHQLRVAAIANIICDNFTDEININKDLVIKACLLHDMGNIIKFKLDYFPEFLEPKGLEYWQNVQNEYIDKYGKNEHKASLKIIKEIGNNDNTADLVDCIGFLTAQDTAKGDDFNKKICAYADMRISPQGVVPLDGRLQDIRERYGKKEDSSSIINRGSDYIIDPAQDQRVIFEESLRKIEKQIFENCKIKPSDIDEILVFKYIGFLKDFTL